MSVSFCLPHPVAVSAFMICRGLCACTEMLWMCVLYVSFGSLSCSHDDPTSSFSLLFLLSILSDTKLKCLWKDMDGSIITPSILGLRSIGSCVSSGVICIWNWCLSGVKSVTVDFWRRDQKRVILQVDAYFSQVIVDHGLQLWNLWSNSPDCDVISVVNPLDRWNRP